jgi:hypothetical protein
VAVAAGGVDDLVPHFSNVKRALLFLFVLAACGVPFAITACSSSSSGGAAPSSSGDDGGLVDAPDYHDVYPAPHPAIPPMSFNGGRVIPSPQLVTVTFVGMDTTLRDYLRDFNDKITTTNWWSTVMNGYGVGAGSGGGYAELPDVFTGQETADMQVQGYIADQVTKGALPTPTDSTIYLLYIPYTAFIDLGTDRSCSQFLGYHGSGKVVVSGSSQTFLYAIINDCRGPSGTAQQLKDDQTYTTSHEVAEAATDPDVNTSAKGGWYVPGGNDAWVRNRAGGENADMCQPQTWLEAPWTVTRVWNAASVAANGAPCLPSPTTWYFNAAVVTENPKKDEDAGPNADGYIVVRKGETRSFEIDVFSTQPLPNDLTLAVGHFPSPIAGQPYDPTHASQIYGGVKAALSQTTARNGDRVALTITIDPTLHTITDLFSVRAVLSPTDYHSWPVILYVP